MTLPFLFAGPSIFGLSASLLEPSFIHLKPPAIRGDIELLLDQIPEAGTIILADGRFHSELSVGHIELRRAIQKGWEVWGVSSMGAIRACEMRHMGMKGFGQVYSFFVNDPEMADDEVALLYAPLPPYSPCSEPLIHIRLFLQYLVANGTLTPRTAAVIVESLKNRWFGFRTLDLLAELLTSHGNLTNESLSKCIARVADFRIKTSDVAGLLKQFRSKCAD